MVIDQNLVLFEGTVATKKGNAVGLTSLQIPGKADPIYMTVKATETLEGATSVIIALQESDTETGTYTDVPGAEITIKVADFVKGKKLAWRFLPSNVTKQWIKLDVEVSGTATAGKLFACIDGYEEAPYGEGQYFNKGEKVG